jgi:hypothetical protein
MKNQIEITSIVIADFGIAKDINSTAKTFEGFIFKMSC